MTPRTPASIRPGDKQIHKEGLFPCGSDGKESACNVGHPGLIPGSGRSPREGNGNPLQYSCLGSPMDRQSRRLQSMGYKESDMTERPTHTHAKIL